MKKIPVRIDNFKQLMETDCYYVDKTKIVEEILSSGSDVILFTRPRRFGKTLIMSMLENFFNIDKKDENKDLFKDLYISNSEYSNYQNEYPTIFMSFKDLKGNNFDELFETFKILISNIFKEKEYIYGSLDEVDKNIFNNYRNRTASYVEYSNSLKRLTEWLHRYYNKKVIVLIDEYDTPIQEAYLKCKNDIENMDSFYNKTINLIRNTFSQVFKTNFSLQKGVLTGILKVSKESMFSTFNNPEVNTLINNTLGEYFGFTHEETKEIFDYYNTELTDEVSKMYDGYLINGAKVYNP